MKVKSVMFCLTFIFGLSCVEAADVIIPDKTLERVLRRALDKWGVPLTEEDLAGLTVLEDRGRYRNPGTLEPNIRDLSGLEHCINLTPTTSMVGLCGGWSWAGCPLGFT